MPLWHCLKCHHEFLRRKRETCDWCGSNNVKLLAKNEYDLSKIPWPIDAVEEYPPKANNDNWEKE